MELTNLTNINYIAQCATIVLIINYSGYSYIYVGCYLASYKRYVQTIYVRAAAPLSGWIRYTYMYDHAERSACNRIYSYIVMQLYMKLYS